MQSRTEGFKAEVEVDDTSKNQPKIFELYEEYNQRSIAETIRSRKEAYERADR